LTVWGGFGGGRRRGWEGDRGGRGLVPGADRLQERQPFGAGARSHGQLRGGAVAALVEPMEHGDRQPRVEAVARDGLATGACDGVGQAVECLFGEAVGEDVAGDARCRIPTPRPDS
jgi:hypothetical protein